MTTPAIPAEVLDADVEAGSKALAGVEFSSPDVWDTYRADVRAVLTAALPGVIEAAEARGAAKALMDAVLDPVIPPGPIALALLNRAKTYRKSTS